MIVVRWFIAVSAVLWISSAVAEPFVQSNESFAVALDNRSTAPSFVLITVVDDRTHETRNGCTLAQSLIGAIVRERRLEWPAPKSGDAFLAARAKVRRIALAAPNHVFHFSRAEALANLRLDSPKDEEACRLIRAGFEAYMADLSGQIIKGRPGFLPSPPGEKSK